MNRQLGVQYYGKYGRSKCGELRNYYTVSIFIKQRNKKTQKIYNELRN